MMPLSPGRCVSVLELVAKSGNISAARREKIGADCNPFVTWKKNKSFVTMGVITQGSEDDECGSRLTRHHYTVSTKMRCSDHASMLGSCPAAHNIQQERAV